MRCHDDEMAAPVRGRCNDGFIGLHVLHMNRIAGHTGLLGRIGRAIQHARSVSLICSVYNQPPSRSSTIMTVTLAPTLAERAVTHGLSLAKLGGPYGSTRSSS